MYNEADYMKQEKYVITSESVTEGHHNLPLTIKIHTFLLELIIPQK